MNLKQFIHFREKKKEKDREELWKRLSQLDINKPDPAPRILTTQSMTSFLPQKSSSHTNSSNNQNTSTDSKSPNSSTTNKKISTSSTGSDAGKK